MKCEKQNKFIHVILKNTMLDQRVPVLKEVSSHPTPWWIVFLCLRSESAAQINPTSISDCITSQQMSREPVSNYWKMFENNVLCNQLTLLSWHQEVRKKYPYLDESVNDEVFIQHLMHFLFSTLDPTEAAENFHGMWPLNPGDKKAECQFRFVTSLLYF